MRTRHTPLRPRLDEPIFAPTYFPGYPCSAQTTSSTGTRSEMCTIGRVGWT